MRFEVWAWCSHCGKFRRAAIGSDPIDAERITEILKRHRRGLRVCVGSGTDADPQ